MYRRYRPVKLEEVVGQDQVTKPLISSLKQGKISHAYLFIGPRGCGKTSVARILAHEVNGFKYEIEDDYVDIIEIDGASNRGIDNIRELREKVAIAPSKGKYKVYIIDEVHMLTKEAFNALLKTLEEPPEHAIFIMATTDAYKVPVTITSRAQTYTFKLADYDTMFRFLKGVTASEKLKIDDDALSIITRRGGGSFRDSLSLLDQISTLSDKIISNEMVINALGLPQDEKVEELISSYLTQDVSNISSCITELLSSGVKVETLVDEMIGKIIADPNPAYMPLLARLPDVKSPYAEAKLLVALVNPGASDTARAVPQSRAQAGQSNERPAIRAKEPLPRPSEPSPKNEELTSEIQDSMPQTSEDVASPEDFDWDSFLAKVQEKSDAIYSQLSKTKHIYSSGIIHIYPMKNVIRNILIKTNNKNILSDATPTGVKVVIHEANESPTNEKKDAILSKISDIMGGEVSYGGRSPF